MTASADATPVVTVLLSVYNGGPYIRRAVASILAQTFGDFEFIIIDDGSTDGTAAILDAFDDPRIRRITHPVNRGLTASLNEGLALARGQYIARQDADDVSLPDRLARQVAYLQAHPDIVVVGAQARLIDAAGRRIPDHMLAKPLTPAGVRFKLLFDGPLIHSSVMFRRDVVQGRFGGYDPSWPTNQDYELWSRLAQAGCAMANLPDVLVEHRHHGGQISAGYDIRAAERVWGRMQVNVRAICRCDDDVSNWLTFWMAVLFPSVPTSIGRVGPALRALRHICRRFAEVHPDPMARRDIRWHLASTLLTAFYGCIRYRPWSAVRCLLRALWADPLATVSIVFDSIGRCAGRLFAGTTPRAADPVHEGHRAGDGVAISSRCEH